MITFLKEQINALIVETHAPLPTVDYSNPALLDIEARMNLIMIQAKKIQAGKDLMRLLRVGQELDGITQDEFSAVMTAANLGIPYDSDQPATETKQL